MDPKILKSIPLIKKFIGVYLEKIAGMNPSEIIHKMIEDGIVTENDLIKASIIYEFQERLPGFTGEITTLYMAIAETTGASITEVADTIAKYQKDSSGITRSIISDVFLSGLDPERQLN